MQSHPYMSLPERHFWRRAVAERNPLDWRSVYQKRFAITPRSRISSAGSCFAQHIGRSLQRRGFTYQDFEPPPPSLPRNQHQEFGYGLYSARFGNIYTARQLLQLFLEAFGLYVPKSRAWEENGIFLDPFRPSVEPAGFGSIDELMALRTEQHLAAVRRMFRETDLFVFTFGLTEAWLSSDDGAVYPLCPGVIAGQFDPDKHRFHNFTYNEILNDVARLIEESRKINSALKFLFTVSPIPLTATATDQHVLVATSYSKSVLRAVVGEIYQTYDFVDYFPSYELLTASPTRGIFFESNMRSIAPAGVDFAMGHFFAEHGADAIPSPAATTKDADRTNRQMQREREIAAECEEERLDSA